MQLLIPRTTYLEAGVHIGTRAVTKAMKRFVYRIRPDGLAMLAIEKIDQRISLAARILAQFEPSRIVIVATRAYSVPAARAFGAAIGARVIEGHFPPGAFTNPASENFFEPACVLICDPRLERQAAVEATSVGAVTVGLIDTENALRYFDFVIPCNNKGRKSVPLILWLLARELKKARGEIKTNEQFTPKVSEFELPEEKVVEKKEVEEKGEEIES